MTRGVIHWHGAVQSTGVRVPTLPWGWVIHHQQRCRSQQQVATTITRLSWSGEFQFQQKSFKRRRSRGHRSVRYEGDVDDAVEWRQINLHTLCDVSASDVSCSIFFPLITLVIVNVKKIWIYFFNFNFFVIVIIIIIFSVIILLV